MSIEQLQFIRSFEYQIVMALLQQEAENGAHVLELGAGVGWQAELFAQAGYKVDAIDLAKSVYANDRRYPIREYDGRKIPFPDKTFDVVFSSNVLEHVTNAEFIQSEIRRVLKSSGVAIHVVPSATWRLWSNLAHYPYIVGRAYQRAFWKPDHSSTSPLTCDGATDSRRSKVSGLIRRALIPKRDGELGNALTELYYFSRWRWRRLFRGADWRITRRASNRLFYTAYYTLGSRLSIRARERLSHLLGGSCHIFVLRP
jgi:SAM-dependent methyltransferase